MTRDTTTGSDFESIVERAIQRSSIKNNFKAISQQIVGQKPGGGKHRVDWELVDNDDENIRGLVSCKFQKSSGTAEEKIVFDVIKLINAMNLDSRYVHSWITMGGDGWSTGMREFVKNDLKFWIPSMQSKLTIITSTDQLISNGIKLRN